MKVAIHNGDGTHNKFPNLALMKISAWHKAHGDTVEWFTALDTYDRVYSSKVFTFTQQDPYLPPNTFHGGTGSGMPWNWVLDFYFETREPDYSIYPDFKHALGFCTRGCVRKCPWCVVPKKEGELRFVQSIESMTQERKSIVLLDNNFLAYENHMTELESCIRRGICVDFNQGLDARLVTAENAALLAKIKWIDYIRFSCDTPDMLQHVEHAARLVRQYGYKSNNGERNKVFCYVLVRDVMEAHSIVERLRVLNIMPFAQAYMDFSSLDKRTREQKRFCRWVNNRMIYNSCKWKDYK